MTRTRVAYEDSGKSLEGYLVSLTPERARPGVLVVPTWMNVNDSICRRADRIAELGYTVFVADLFGAGVRPGPPQLPQSVVAPFLEDRLPFRKRLFASFHALQSRQECDANRIAAVGYCLGGCGVLELARSGAPLTGVICLHGILSASMLAKPGAVNAKILVLHGDADRLPGRDEARTGLRMMPTSPRPSLKFRKADFLRYGFKAGISGGPSCRLRVLRVVQFASVLRTPRYL